MTIGLRRKSREFTRTYKKSEAFKVGTTSEADGRAHYYATLLWFEKQVKQTVNGVAIVYGIRADPVDLLIHYLISKGPILTIAEGGVSLSALTRAAIANVFQSYRLVGAGTGVIETTDEFINEDMTDDMENEITAPGESLNVYVASDVAISFEIGGTLEITESWTQRIFADDMSEHELDMHAEEDFELLHHEV